MAASSIFNAQSTWQNNYNTHHDRLSSSDKSKADDITGKAYGAVNEKGSTADAKLQDARTAYDNFQGSGAPSAAKKDLLAAIDAAQLGHDQNAGKSRDTLKTDLEAAFGAYEQSQGKGTDMKVSADDFNKFTTQLGDDIKNNPTFQQSVSDVTKDLNLK